MSKKIMLDAGHGLSTPGKQTPNGLKEFTLNVAVVNLIMEILSEYEIEVRCTHDATGRCDIPLPTRVEKTNKYKPDVFVSIHHNAFKGTWGWHSGVETYLHSRCRAADKKLAIALAKNISAATGLKNRGAKLNRLLVLTCRPTAVLCEGGFMDSFTDHSVITSHTGQHAYAKAVAETLIAFLDLKKCTDLFYRVIIGSFTSKENALKKQGTLTQSGIETFILPTDTHYRLVAGSYKTKSHAETQKEALHKKGIEAFITQSN